MIICSILWAVGYWLTKDMFTWKVYLALFLFMWGNNITTKGNQ